MTEPSNPNGWADAMASFDAWAELPDARRVAWLGDLARAQPELHERLAALIRADRDAEDRSFLSPGDASASAAGRSMLGQRFGPWFIEQLIGTGGMGQVWLARRTDGLYDGRAAIKLMRIAVADAAANGRFAREGQLLGRLSHPNIARLLDAGVTESGERYLVLEYVDGERIDRYCDRLRLTVAERVALFIVVCEAVAHAHENLVVHRDLKPSNIFVTADGQVKLLDFGVAKLLVEGADPAGDESELTRAGGAAMTPQYASPEQLTGGTVTTATDVYGLGMVLYGLLSGSRPFGGDATPTPLRAAILTAEPRPLWSLPDASVQAERIASERATSVATLRKTLRGDVAVVIGKAIKADAAERYRSVPDFADDLQRTLDQRPIAARPDSAAYRGAKFVRRHWFGVGAAVLIGLAIAAGVTGTLIKQREAEREAERAVAVKRFLLDLFEQARSSVRSGGTQTREATVNDMLAAGADRVDTSFAAQPAIRDEVFQILVELYSDTGEPKQIVALARRRLAAAQAGFGPRDARTAPAEVMMAGVLLNFGEAGEAAKLLGHAQMLLDQAGDRTSIERARLLRWQGVMAMITEAKPPWAEHPLRLAVELLRTRYADDDELLSALASLPSLACHYGEADEAMAAAEELHRRTLARYGDDNLFVDEADEMRGQLMALNGRAPEALPVLERALEGFRRHVGAKSPNMVQAQLGLATAYQAAGRAGASQRAYEAARQAIEHDHADDKRLAQQIAGTREDIDKLRSGQTLRCKR